MKKEYDFAKIEKKWQKKWADSGAFKTNEKSKKQKYYVLEMFPYPSSSGLHMGHAFNYLIGDIYARFMRMNKLEVLYPMGYDAFGLPAENAAIKEKVHPKKFTLIAINNFIKQQKALGLSYDWDRMIITCEPDYYKWNQLFFLKFLEKGLAYRKKAIVNFCEKCDTVLANEQVHQGKCWRHTDTEVKEKELEQWFLRITDYAEELLKDIEKLDWPERIKTMQRNWIGKSEGAEIVFKINGKKWRVFTTRADTLFGATFLVISARHPKLMELVSEKQRKEVEKFLKRVKGVKQEDIEKLDKEGVFTGSYAEHPLTGEQIPVWAGNFVLAEYGSGMVMGVPAHDSRDFEFAKKYKLEIKQVIKPDDKKIDAKKIKEAYDGSGVLINSFGFNGLFSEEAKEHIVVALSEKGLGKKKVQYKLRDWLISRQRYWGTPIPVVYCPKCGIVPVPEKELPVVLPEKVKFGKGNPLESNKTFLNVKCYKCGSKGRRETDTMDTFFDSSWYFLRYIDSKNKKEPFSTGMVNKWMPVDQYIGGAEHACMHLIYARFFTKALRDLGYVEASEPFQKLFNQGMLHKSGFVMSKSKGNVVLPEEVSDKYGIDTARLFLVSIANPDKDIEWSDAGIKGSMRFIMRVYNFMKNYRAGKTSPKLESKLHKTIKQVTDDIRNFRYNIAVIKLRELFELIEKESHINEIDIENFIKMFSVFCSHLGEEFWEMLGNKSLVSLESWPEADASKIDEKFEEAEKNVEKLKNDIINVKNITNLPKMYTYIYAVPSDAPLFKEYKDILTSTTGSISVSVFATNEKNIPDPEGKAKKAKPGKPGIYLSGTSLDFN